jgi:hypothetical protein
MDAPHTTNGHVKTDITRRESFGSQDSQTAKEYAPHLHTCRKCHANVKANSVKIH